MEAGGARPGPNPFLRAEIVHSGERTRITRLFLPGRTVIRKEPLGQDVERTARFYLASGLEHAGYGLLAQARQEHAAWGTTAKVEQLDWAYPFLRPQSDATAGHFGK